MELREMDYSTLSDLIVGKKCKFVLEDDSVRIGIAQQCECASNINPHGGGHLPVSIIVDGEKINIMIIKEILLNNEE